MLLKNRKLVSKFENPSPGTESYLATMRKIPWQSRKALSSTFSSLLAVEFTMVFNALQINSYVFSEECKGKKICSVDERWHLRSANSASTTSPSHWPSSGDVWVRACNVWLPQGPSYSMNVVVRVGKQRLYKPRNCHQILTSSRTVRLRQTTTCGSVNRAKSVNGDVDGSGRP